VGIAALLVAVAAAVAILLLSLGGDDPKVTPLRENAAQHQTDGNGAPALPLTRFRPPVPVPGDRDAATDGDRSKGERKSSTRRAGSRGHGVEHERIFRPSRAAPKKKAHKRRTIPSPPPSATAPQPVSAPAAPAQPPTEVPPSPIEPRATQPTRPSNDTSDEDARPVEVSTQVIEIEDGELDGDVNRIKSTDRHIRLRIRSDELVLVDLEDGFRTWLVPAGGETLIEFDASSSRSFGLDLHHHKGMLVLHLRD
jgi:hypothetical protein